MTRMEQFALLVSHRECCADCGPGKLCLIAEAILARGVEGVELQQAPPPKRGRR